MKLFFTILTSIFLFILPKWSGAQCVPCDVGTTTYVVDLSSNPDTTWTISSTRSGLCCGATGSTNCIRFEVTVHPSTTEIGFNVANPSPPGGAFYQVDCGAPTSLGTPLCVTSSTTFCISFCKSGGDSPTYTISASQSFSASPDVAINSNCFTDLFVTGLDESTIQWNSIEPGNLGDYNGYLSCTSLCDTTSVTPQPGYPPYIDFEVTGTPVGCASGTSRDTVRVYINEGVVASITPNPAFVCFGSADAVLTGNAIGGAPPYSYNWSTGETTQSITVAVGTYWVEVSDTSSNCPPATDTVVVTASGGPITANAGVDQIVCSSAPDIILSGTVTQASGGIWTGGTGTFSPNDSTLNATYTPSATEITAGSVTLTLTTYGNGGCTAATDVMIITIQQAPVVDAGTDIGICEGDIVILSGTISGGAGTGQWTSSGTGVFTPSSTDLNVTYTPSAADATMGTITLTLTATASCSPVSDPITITVTPLILVSAGIDQAICIGDPVSLLGSITGGSTTGIWTSSGTGVFTPSNTDLNATYTPSAADEAAGTATLTLTSTNNVGCVAAVDQIVISIQAAPVVAAGGDVTLCEGETASLSASIIGGSGQSVWSSSGSGTFTPSATDLNAVYSPSPADALSGTITLTLSTINSCLFVTDQLIVTIIPSTVVSADLDQTVCQNAPDVSLTGSVTGGTTTGQWLSSGSGTFTPSNTDLGAIYTPSAADITAGTITLTLESTGNGSCLMVSDTMVVTITTAPIVNAGADVIMCANNVINLAGTVSGFTTTGVWATSGTGTFSPSATDLNAVYTPSVADTTAGSLTVTLTSTNNSSCIPVSNDMVITFSPAPIVNAGTDQTVCENNAIASLNGTVSAGATTGIWASSGTGSFNPSNTDLGGDYVLTPADTLTGNVSLVLTSTNNGTCLSVQDTMIVSVISAPIVNAGTDVFVCLGDNASLTGVITNGSGTGQWTTSGTGAFAPSDTDLNAVYTPSAADESTGTITLTLSSTNNGNCLPVLDDVLLTFVTQPVVAAGADIVICASDSAQLAGAVSGSSTTGQWATSGDGFFIPSTTDLNAVYVLGPNDISSFSVIITLESTNSCLNTDQLQIAIMPGPIVGAGLDQIICITETQVNLNGFVGGVTTTGEWTASGTGTFIPSNTNLSTTYNLTSADSLAGQFDLILTSTANGSCSAVSDTVHITMTTIPVVDAGIDTSFCANNMGILNGVVTGGASTGQWTTSGTGAFSPSATDLNATYVPSIADTTTGLVVLTLTSTAACLDISDVVNINITPGPIANAGADTTICNSANLQLSGVVYGASFTGQWSTSGDGTFTPTATDLNAVYTPGTSDLSNATFELYLSPTNIGDCSPTEDTINVSIQSLPVVDGGGNQIVCSGSSVAISGSISGGVGGQWTTLGTGTFSNTNLNTNYIPSTTDTTAGTVQLILTSDPLGLCGQDSDTITVFFEDLPIVDAGLDITVCANNDTVYLVGITTNGEGVWSTNGDGIFTPNDSLLAVWYLPGTNDESVGQTELYLTPTNLQGCPQVSDTVIINITPAPLVDAGADISICLNNLLVSLSGSITGGASTGVWSTDGTGTFIPDNLSLGTNYQPSTADTTNGLITFVLTSTNNGNCLVESDTLEVTFDTAPVVNAGSDIIICQSDTALIQGTISGGGTVLWITSGTGVFVDNTVNPVSYIPSASDTLTPIEMYIEYTNGCGSVTDTLIATILPSPGLTVSYVVDCETFEVAFEAQTNAGIIDSLYWDFGDGGNDTVSSPIHTYLSDGIYPVEVYIETTDGCSDISNFNIAIEPLPVATFIVNDSVIMIGDVIEFNDTSLNAAIWEWNFGDLSGTYFVEDTTYSYDTEGDYTVLLIVSNNSGCSDSVQILIEVLSDDAVFPPAIPNAFTPNGDNINDLLFVRGGPFDSFDLRIYNEWGNEIYKSENQSEGWNGIYKGKEQPVGVYIYIFNGITTDGVEHSLTGDVSLIK